MSETFSKHKAVDRIRSSLFYSAIGDAVGFRYEFVKDTAEVLSQANQLGGISAIRVDKQWPVSDDTVMQIATARAIIDTYKDCNVNQEFGTSKFVEAFQKNASIRYVECMKQMKGRAPGNQCILATRYLEDNALPPYSSTAGGNGASMRSACIGFVAPTDTVLLVDMSMRSALLTHPNFTAMFGSVASTVFTALAYQEISPTLWPEFLMQRAMPLAEAWLRAHRLDWTQKHGDFYNPLGDYRYFETQWETYIDMRFTGADGSAFFSQDWITDHQGRDAFFNKLAYVSPNGTTWNGSSGHDSVIIAYDAILYDCLHCPKVNGDNSLYTDKADWDTVLYLTALHGGDSDSTAAIAGAWFGAMHPMRIQKVQGLEFGDDMDELAKEMSRLL